MTTVRVADLRAAKVCRDARIWCERNGLSWRECVLHGVDAEVLRKIPDQQDVIERVIAAAEKRETSDG